MEASSKFTAIVVGGGFAGLSAAIALGKNHIVKLVSGKPNSSTSSYISSLKKAKVDPYVGIWTGGLESAESISPGLINELERHGRYIDNACYMNSSGYVLARPSQPLTPLYDNGSASILFVRQSKLLSALWNRLPRNVEIIQADMNLLTENNQSEVSIQTCGGRTIRGDLLIGADGRCSRVRQQLFYSNQNTLIEPLSYRGYRIYRGTSLLPNDSHRFTESFQSWGESSRFAAVPVRDGISWFATVQESYVTTHDPYEANGLGISTLTHKVTLEEKEALANNFITWHDPILSIIRETESISMENSLGFRSFPTSFMGRVLLIGDAAYCLDPILAQGLGIAFEDSNELYTVLNTLIEGATDEIPGALAWVGRKRRQRAQLLHRISNIAQNFALCGSLSGARDLLMRVSPTLSSKIFDAALKLVADKGCVERAGPR